MKLLSQQHVWGSELFKFQSSIRHSWTSLMGEIAFLVSFSCFLGFLLDFLWLVLLNIFWSLHPFPWGFMIQFDEYFSNGLVQSPTRLDIYMVTPPKIYHQLVLLFFLVFCWTFLCHFATLPQDEASTTNDEVPEEWTTLVRDLTRVTWAPKR